MEKTLHMSISGDFITRIARSWFWDENRPYEKSEALLLCALNGNGLSEDEMKVICRDIIEGRKNEKRRCKNETVCFDVIVHLVGIYVKSCKWFCVAI